ncbi:serine/threonine protein kinase IREH1 [Spatholobus suberectus]|nr:serine/threonine protein kinase IREH1 [Spatholobus suberectus]
MIAATATWYSRADSSPPRNPIAMAPDPPPAPDPAGKSTNNTGHATVPAAPSRLQHGQSSSQSGRQESSWAQSGGLRSADFSSPETGYDYENSDESESPRFQAILRVTSAPRKRFPGDIKSFSHELKSKGVRPFPFWKPRRLNKGDLGCSSGKI